MKSKNSNNYNKYLLYIDRKIIIIIKVTVNNNNKNKDKYCALFA